MFLQKQRANIYTMLLILAFLNIIVGCLFLYLEMNSYGFKVKVPPEYEAKVVALCRLTPLPGPACADRDQCRRELPHAVNIFEINSGMTPGLGTIHCLGEFAGSQTQKNQPKRARMLPFVSGLFGPDLAIDLGTANTLIGVPGEGLVLERAVGRRRRSARQRHAARRLRGGASGPANVRPLARIDHRRSPAPRRRDYRFPVSARRCCAYFLRKVRPQRFALVRGWSSRCPAR